MVFFWKTSSILKRQKPNIIVDSWIFDTKQQQQKFQNANLNGPNNKKKNNKKIIVIWKYK